MNVQTVYIEITNQCNLNCRTCYNRSGLNRQRQEMSVSQLKDIIQLFQRYGCQRFLLSGGEPTLHSDLGNILSLIESLPDLSFGLVTNGTFPDDRLLSLLERRENFLLQISLDGSCEKQNARTRGAGYFDKAVAFARHVYQPNGQKPRLKMVISQSNADDVTAFYKLALTLNCTPELAFIYRCGNGTDRWEDKKLDDRQKIQLSRQIDQLNQQYGMNAILPTCTFGCPFTNEMNALSLCVKVDGSIQPCQSLYDTAYTVGNALAFDEQDFIAGIQRIRALAQQRQQQDYRCAIECTRVKSKVA